MNILGSVLFYSVIFDEITLLSEKHHGLFVGEHCETLLTHALPSVRRMK